MSSFDLRRSTLRTDFRAGTLTPRKLIAGLRAKAAALNPEFLLFIHLLSEAEVASYLDWLETQDIETLPLYGIPLWAKGP